MPTFTQYIWNNEKIGFPPAKRKLKLAYYEPKEILLSFTCDLTPAGETYLDIVKAIRINGKPLSIPDLPQNPMMLRLVDKQNIDATALIKSGPPGIENEFEVNYIVKGVVRSIFKRHVGILTMLLTITLPETEKKGKEEPKEPSVTDRFCMHCGAAMPLSANFCPTCGRQPPGGIDTKGCRNCGKTIPFTAKFCNHCGKLQPAE